MGLPGTANTEKGGKPIKRTGFRVALIALVLAAAMAAVIFFQANMIKSVNTASEKKVISLLSDNANQVKCVLDSQINSIWAHMDIIDNALEAIQEMSKEEAVRFLSEIIPMSYQIEFVTPDGEYLNRDGKKGFVATDKDAFRLFLNREKICVLRQEGTEDTLMFGIPVSPVLVEGKEYRFVLAYFKLDDLMNVLAVESFAGKGQIRVLNDQGFVIMSSENIDRDKTSYYFFKLYRKAKFIDNDRYEDFEDFRSSVMNGENYAVHVSLNKETDHVISYVKTENLNWYVTIVVDYQSVLGGLEKNVETIGATSILFTVAVVLIALLLVSVISADVYKIRQEKQQLQELNVSLDNAKQVAEQALAIAESANRSKSAFLSNMSHDIRTPLNAITGFNDLLAKNADNPQKVLEYTGKISSSSRHLLGLINDVLDMSKIESGTTTLSLTEEQMGDILADIDSIIRPQMQAKNHTFRISARNLIHKTVIVDKTRLSQILINLLSNAVKYTPEGGNVELTVSEIKSSQNTAWYQITVSDNGYGMSPEFVDTVFDSFSREESSQINQIQGTGLGMAITKSLVELMGGSIEVASEKGKGSIFTVTLQLQLGGNDITADSEKESSAPEPITESREATVQTSILAGKHILIAEDNELNAEIMRDMLSFYGAKSTVYGNGQLAQDAFENSLPGFFDLIFMDIQMPVKNGYETTRAIRASGHPQAGTIPIIAMTADAFAEDVKAALDAGMNAHISKPVDMRVVEDTLQQIFIYKEPQ